MAASSQHPPAGKSNQAICRFLLPSPSGEPWFLDIPADLVGCIGRYARIPEFVRDSHLLSPVRLTQERAP